MNRHTFRLLALPNILVVLFSAGFVSANHASAVVSERELKNCPMVDKKEVARRYTINHDYFSQPYGLFSMIGPGSDGVTVFSCAFPLKGFKPTRGRTFDRYTAVVDTMAFCGRKQAPLGQWKLWLGSTKLFEHRRRVSIGVEAWAATNTRVNTTAMIIYRTGKAVVQVLVGGDPGDLPMPVSPLIRFARLMTGFGCTPNG